MLHARNVKQHEAWLYLSTGTEHYMEVLNHSGDCLHKLIIFTGILNNHRVPRLWRMVTRNHEN
jgi:hypothetical protein